MMERQSENRREIVRYLLCEMADLEQSEFEAHCFGADESVAELEMVRDELIEDYIHDALPAYERGRFEHHFLSAPENVERLDQLRALDHALAATTVAVETNAPSSPLKRFVDFFAARISVPVFVAACLALAFGVLLLNLALRRSATTEVAQHDDDNRAAVSQTPAPTPSAPVGSDTPAQATPEASPTTPEGPPVSRPRGGTSARGPSAAVASFLLTPLSRGSAAGGATFRIPSSARVVKLTAEIPPARYINFFAALRRADDHVEVWRKPFTPRTSDSASRVSFLIPAELFTDDNFIFEVKGRDAAGQTENVVSYSFRAVRIK